MKTLLRWIALSSLLAATACSNGDGGGSVGGGGAGGGTSGSFTITADTVQSKTLSQWAGHIDSSSYINTNNLTISITGTCSRGIQTITATVNAAAVAETANCDGTGAFTWTKVYTGPTAANGDAKDIILSGIAADATVLATSSTVKVKIDDQAPATDPVITAPGTLVAGTYTITSAAVNFTGTYTSDLASCTASPSCGTFAYGSGTLTADDVLTLGQVKTYYFKSVDLAGNSSSGGVGYTIQYANGLASTPIRDAMTTPGAAINTTFGGSSYIFSAGVTPFGSDMTISGGTDNFAVSTGSVGSL